MSAEKSRMYQKYTCLLAILALQILLISASSNQFNSVKSNQIYFNGRKGTHNLLRPGPAVTQSHGKIWPKPQLQNDESEVFFIISPANFSFKVRMKIVFILILSW